MFQGWYNHLDKLHRCNELSLELHEAVEAAFAWHGRNRHSFHRLFLVIRGTGSSWIVNHTDGHFMKMVAGSGYFMPSGADLEFNFEPETYFMSFHFNLRSEYFQEIFPVEPHCRILEHCGEKISAALLRLQHAANDWTTVCELKGLLFGWVEQILAQGPMTAPAADDLRREYRDLLGFLETKADARSTLDDFSTVAGMSADTLSRHFSRDFGIPLKRYAMQLLASRAERLLRCRDLKVREVALRLKFQDEYYFSRFFKRETGCSPREFRQFGNRKETHGTAVASSFKN